MFRLLAPLPVLVSFVAIASAQQPPARPAVPEVEHKLDLTYAVANGEKLQLDLTEPKAGGPHPVVVCLHGGAWKFGSRKDLSRSMDWLAADGNNDFLDVLAHHGFAAASVSYRFAPKNKFPAQVADAKAAVRYLRANAKSLNLDPERIAVLGFSAGGQLAALVGMTPDRPEFDPGVYPDQSDRVNCVVNFFGPTDMTLFAETPGVDRAYITPLLGKNPEAYAKASPINYVTKNVVPFLTLHGTADVIVPIIHAERLHEKLLAAGAKSVFLPVKGKGHGWGGEAAAETTDAVIRFLTENLGPGPK